MRKLLPLWGSGLKITRMVFNSSIEIWNMIIPCLYHACVVCMHVPGILSRLLRLQGSCPSQLAFKVLVGPALCLCCFVGRCITCWGSPDDPSVNTLSMLCYMCMYVHVSPGAHGSQKRVCQVLGVGLRGSCELWDVGCGCWDLNSSPLQQAFFTDESSFQALDVLFIVPLGQHFPSDL